MLYALFALVVVLIGMGAWYAWELERKRQLELGAFANELALSFDPSNDKDHDDQYAQFEIFRRGHSRIAKNTMDGALDLFGRQCRVRCGDFRYLVTSSNGKTTTTHTYNFSYLIVHPPWSTPPLLVRPEGLFDKLKGAFGFDDIDFESAEFSDRFHVKSTDKRYAYDVLHPRMMEFLMNGDPPTIDVAAGEACFYRRNTVWTADQFNNVLAWTRDFFNLWPRHLQPTTENQPQSS